MALRDLYLVGASVTLVLLVFAARAVFADRIRVGLERYRVWLGATLDELGWRGDAGKMVQLHVAATIALSVIVALLIGLIPAVLVAVLSGWASFYLLNQAKEKRRALFESQLPGMLDAVSAALSQGLNVEHALEITAQNADEPTQGEMLMSIKEYRLGIQLDQALTNMSDRLRSRNLGMVAEAVGISLQTGGNLSEMLKTTARAVQEIARLEEKMNVATAQGRMQTRVIVAMGPICLVILSLIAPEMVDPLFTDPLGWFMLAIAVMLDLIGVLLARKIQEADV